jgi:hypothetical protein
VAAPEKRLRFFDAEFNSITKYNPKQATLDEQIKHYQASTVDLDLEALEFWSRHYTQYPTLAKIVRIVYSIMATSVPSESMFSDGGYEIWDRRNALGPDKAEKTVIIQQHEKNSNNYNNL